MNALIAYTTLAGGYCSTAKIVTMALLAVPWLYLSPWIQRDAKRVMAPATAWASVALAAGAVGMLLWLFIGSFVAGLVVYSLAVAAAGAGYVVYRNQRVDVEYRILTPDHIRSLMGGGARDKLAVQTLLKVYDTDGKILPPPGDNAPIEQRRAYNLAQQLLYDILFYRASEADLSPVGPVGRIRFVVDGALLARPDLDQAQCELVIQHLKGITGMDPAETRRPQKGSLSVDLASQPIDMVLTTAGTTTGQRMQFRVVQESIQTRLEDLGISEDMLDRICELNAEPTGLLIVSSKPKNGLSSTLYSLMRRHDAFTKQLIALEAKAASELENVSQNVYGSQDDLAKALASAIRQEPSVIMVDRCENAEAARLLAEAADKRLILLGVPADSSLTAMAKWVRAVGQPTLAMSSLRGIVNQVLIRKLCPECKEGYAPDPAVLTRANLPLGSTESFYRPPTGPLLDDKGKAMLDKQGLPIPCPTCGGTGYFGRTGVFELLEITDEVRQLVAGGAQLAQIGAACRRSNPRTLQEEALRKVNEGVTSVQEVIRVTQSKKKKK